MYVLGIMIVLFDLRFYKVIFVDAQNTYVPNVPDNVKKMNDEFNDFTYQRDVNIKKSHEKEV